MYRLKLVSSEINLKGLKGLKLNQKPVVKSRGNCWWPSAGLWIKRSKVPVPLAAEIYFSFWVHSVLPQNFLS